MPRISSRSGPAKKRPKRLERRWFWNSAPQEIAHEATKPDLPFEVSRFGKSYRVALPFDEKFRPVLFRSYEDAYAEIGRQVCKSSAYFCPPYLVVYHESCANVERIKALLTDPQYVAVTNNVSAHVTFLVVASSAYAAVATWYSRNSFDENKNTVLCHDRARNRFYIDAASEDLTVFLDVNGKEIAGWGGAVSIGYRVDLHENAMMAFGE